MGNVEEVLTVKGISKVYEVGSNKVHALTDVDFTLYRGEFVVVMGTSGSGKSTLLNIIGGLDVPTEGKIYIQNEEVKNYHKEPYATMYRRDNIGFVFQAYNLLDTLTVAENIALPLILKNYKPKDIELRVNQLMKQLGIFEWKHHKTNELSGGQQQRVALARALITNPPILLADEPTGNLDSRTTDEILQLIVDMKEEFNQSIILVTHDSEVAAYADRVIFFHDGKIVDEYTPSVELDKTKRHEIVINKVKELKKGIQSYV